MKQWQMGIMVWQVKNCHLENSIQSQFPSFYGVKSTVSSAFQRNAVLFFIQYIYFQSDSSAPIQKDEECPAEAKQPRQCVACLHAAFKILIKQRQKDSVWLTLGSPAVPGQIGLLLW